jgi:hypothetical protein
VPVLSGDLGASETNEAAPVPALLAPAPKDHAMTLKAELPWSAVVDLWIDTTTPSPVDDLGLVMVTFKTTPGHRSWLCVARNDIAKLLSF